MESPVSDLAQIFFIDPVFLVSIRKVIRVHRGSLALSSVLGRWAPAHGSCAKPADRALRAFRDFPRHV